MAYTIDYGDAERQFTQFLSDHGLREPHGGFLFDGVLHRCPVEGKSDNDTTGSYIFWPNGKSNDGRPHGWCLNWRDGMRHDWQYKGEYVQPTQWERKAYSAKMKKQEREKKKRSAEALNKACNRFDAAGAARAEHQYLAAKGIGEYRGDIRQDGELLLVPYTRLTKKGVIGTIQRVYPHGIKRFSKGIIIPEDAAFVIDGDKSSDRIFVAEGMATAQSAAAALAVGSGYRAVMAAGNCSRLKCVLEAVRSKYPRAEVFILADDDYKTFLKSGEKRTNPGLDKARILLRNGCADGMLIPPFPRKPDSEDSVNELSDWNDYAQMFGVEAASVELEKQIEILNVSAIRKNAQKDSTVTAEAAAIAMETAKTAVREAKAKAKRETAAEEKRRRRAEFEAHLKDMEAERGLPQILENSQQIREAVTAVIHAMQTVNEKAVSLGGSPRYYFDETSCRIVTVEKYDLGIDRREITTANGLLAISKCADFWKMKGTRGDYELVPSRPSNELVSAVVNAEISDMSVLPRIRGISTTPVVRPDFSVHGKAGYDSVTKIYYDKRLEISIPESPTREDACKAVDVLKDVFADFPFGDKRYFDNTVGLLLSGVLRDADIGRIPMAVIDAPRQGTGKTLLAQTISAILTGSETATSSLVKDAEESRKQITSILRDGDPIVLFDNIAEDTNINTPALSRLLTSDVYSDRLLGTNETFRIRNRAVIISTGNNIRLGGDMPRRTYRIRLDDGRVSSHDRRTFVNPEREGNLISYVKEHDDEILSSVYTLIRAWIAAGKPKWSGKPLESFEKWSRVIGGILEYCGLNSFLKNAENDCDNMCDEDSAQWGAFVEEIKRGADEDGTFTSRSIATRCFLDGALADSVPYSLGSTDDKNFSKVLGDALYRHRERLFRAYDGTLMKICAAGRDRKNVARWQILSMQMKE